jgi:hypothetical protein
MTTRAWSGSLCTLACWRLITRLKMFVSSVGENVMLVETGGKRWLVGTSSLCGKDSIGRMLVGHHPDITRPPSHLS